MSKFFLDILNLSITASWLIVAVLAVRFIFRKRAPKWVSCLLWSFVGLRLLLPFTIESPFSLSLNREVINTDAVYGEGPADTVPPADDTIVPPADNVGGETQQRPETENNTQNPVIVPEPAPETDRDKVYIQSGLDVLDDRINPVINGAVSSVSKTEKDPIHKLVSVLCYIWLAGVGGMLTYAVINYIVLKHRVSASVPCENSVRKSERVDTPFILGVFRPRIYLPFGLSFQTEQSVVAHENAHLKRKDHLIKPLGYAILSVYWFNPLVWVAYILLCRDIESACDEKVIKNMDTEARQVYATALLECSLRRNYIAACPLAFGELGVKDRVKNTMRYKKPAFWVIISAVIICVTVAALFLSSPQIFQGDTSETVSDDISETESALIENPATDFEYEVNPAQNGILIYKYIGTSENVVIPEEIEGLPVLSVRGTSPENSQYAIEEGAFAGTNVKTVVIPKTVISISYLAFNDCKELTSITFADGSGLTKIGGSAFEGCTALKEITLPNTVTEIQARAFYGCSALTEVDLPDGLLKIGGSAFSECTALKKITIPAKLDLNFLNMGDSPLTLVPSLEQIVFEEGREAIRGIALVNGSCDIEITVPKSVKEFSSYPFYIGRDSKTEIIFLGDAPEIVEEGNGNFGVSVIYYDPDTSGWDTFAWKDLYEMKPNKGAGETVEQPLPEEQPSIKQLGTYFPEEFFEYSRLNTGDAVFDINVSTEGNFDDEAVPKPGYVNFIDKDGIGQNWKLAVTVSENIKCFAFIEIDASIAYKVGKVLYVHNTEESDEPLMIHTYLNDISTNRGFCYITGDGEVVYGSSGRDYNQAAYIGAVLKGNYCPKLTGTEYKWEGNDIFEEYFNNYVLDEYKTEWTHIGVTEGVYTDFTYKGYTKFDVYRVEYNNTEEYYAVPYDETQIEAVYKFQFDDTMIPVWIKPQA